MATVATINFHNQQMADNRERVRLRIANGLKSDSSNIITERRMNPSYRGMIKNSTGSRCMPFFASTNEIFTSLEDKIKARNGVIQPRNPFIVPKQMALPMQTHVDATNQIDINPDVIAAPFRSSTMRGGVLTDFKYAKKILNRRKLDVLNQERVKAGIPREADELTMLSEIDSRKLELANILDYIGQSVAVGDFNVVSSIEARSLFRLIISLAPAFKEDELVEIVRVLENIAANLEEGERDDTNGVVTLDARTAKRKQTQVAAAATVVDSLMSFLRAIGAIINRPAAEKAQLATVLARQLGSVVGLKDTLNDIERTIDNMRTNGEVIASTSFPEAPQAGQDLEQQTGLDSDFEDGPTPPTVPRPAPPRDVTPALPRPAPIGAAEAAYEIRKNAALAEAQEYYNRNDIPNLQRLLRENNPRLRAEKYFRANASRTVLLNAIKNSL